MELVRRVHPHKEHKTSRRALSVQEKTEIFKFIDENKPIKQKDIAAKYKISISTVSDILKNRTQLEKIAQEHGSCIKRLKSSKFDRVNKELIQWFHQAVGNNIKVNGVITKDKAKEIASQLGINDFTASNGWLGRFKTRYGVLLKRNSKRNRTVREEGVDCWKTTILPAVIAKFEPKDIYSVDLFGLSSSTLLEQNPTKKPAGIHSNDQFTILLCSNFDGSDRIRPWVFGTNDSLRHTPSLPYTYIFSPHAWMTKVEFEEWVDRINAKMVAENRRILLIVDNTAAYSDIPEATNVKIVLSPLNVSSCLKPIYQDILKTTRQLFREMTRCWLLDLGSKNVPVTRGLIKDHVLKMVTLFEGVWEKVTKESFKECFSKSGILRDPQRSLPIAEINGILGDPEKSLPITKIKQECPSPSPSLSELENENCQDLVPIKTEADDDRLQECNKNDDFMETSHQQITDSIDSEDLMTNDFEEEIPHVSIENALASIDNIKNFMAQNSGFEDSHWNNLAEIENMIFIKSTLNRRKQMKILQP